ncbi:anti-repressor Ant [Heliothis virescens ascovirus 3f]|uniref:Bro21 n=1 Tax=Heliothis virescens ascovirus 3f TaxID=328614 RepID=A0A171PVP2_9VIRU|nr:anti-repressor Ant [Heliothis virescens ascovirus 3f]AJP09123.1 Bro21 [Heliothis virescens ascovirus 3f]
MAALTKRSYSMGTKSCDVWIVEIPRANKEPLMMVSAHGIGELLGYKQPAHAVRNHVKPKYRKTWEEIKQCMLHSPLKLPINWQSNTVFIAEPGIYALCNKSNLPESETFQDWICDEVLPEMRRAGRLIDEYTHYAADHRHDIDQNTVAFMYVASTQLYRSKGIYKI